MQKKAASGLEAAFLLVTYGWDVEWWCPGSRQITLALRVGSVEQVGWDVAAIFSQFF